MFSDEDWKELSGYANGAMSGVIKVLEPMGVDKAVNLSKVAAGKLPYYYDIIPVSFATVTVKPSLQRNVSGKGQVTWGTNKNKGTTLTARFSDHLLYRAGLLSVGTEIEFWMGLEGSSWRLFSGWISTPVSQSLSSAGAQTVMIKATDNADYPSALFEQNPIQAMLYLKSLGTVEKVLEKYCEQVGWVLDKNSGLDELKEKYDGKAAFAALFESCTSFNTLLDRIIIQNGNAYYIEKQDSGKVFLTIVGKSDLKCSYTLQYASAKTKSFLDSSVLSITRPYDHLQPPLSTLFKYRDAAILPVLIGADFGPSVRALSIGSIRPNKNQLAKQGGIVNTARMMVEIDKDGKIRLVNTAIIRDVLVSETIWEGTKHLGVIEAAALAMGKTRQEFLKLGWVIEVIRFGAEESFTPEELAKRLEAVHAIGYECSVKTVGFPYPSSHDIIFIKGVHARYEERQWRLMQWTHNYAVGRGWFTNLKLGT